MTRNVNLCKKYYASRLVVNAQETHKRSSGLYVFNPSLLSYHHLASIISTLRIIYLLVNYNLEYVNTMYLIYNVGTIIFNIPPLANSQSTYVKLHNCFQDNICAIFLYLALNAFVLQNVHSLYNSTRYFLAMNVDKKPIMDCL